MIYIHLSKKKKRQYLRIFGEQNEVIESFEKEMQYFKSRNYTIVQNKGLDGKPISYNFMATNEYEEVIFLITFAPYYEVVKTN